MTGPRVALYVTGHGYGHAVRAAEVARTLLARGAHVLVRTEAPAWLFPQGAEVLPAPGRPVDVGVVQNGSLEMDIGATRERWRAFASSFDQRAEREAELLREVGARVVLGDVPPLAFAAAARAGLPSLAMTNFGWDWIYAAWPGFDDAVEAVRRGYSQAQGLLRLPFHPTDPDAFPAFRAIEDVPVVARTARVPRSVVRDRLGIPPDATAVLLSFGGFDVASLDVPRLGELAPYRFVLTPAQPWQSREPPPGNVHLLERDQTDYPSLVAACDVVVTKPGYGIVADALANRVPVLYTDRGPFREYPVLAAALERFGPARHIPREDLLAGRLRPFLEDLLALPRVWEPLALNGAEVVAEQLLLWGAWTSPQPDPQL